MVELERDSGIARIFLNRPEKVNALNSRLLETLAAELERLAGDEALRVVVLAGRGKVFCAGADVGELAVLDAATAPAFVGRVHRVCAALRALPVPVVARLHGRVVRSLLAADRQALWQQKQLLQLWEEAPLARSIDASLARFAEAYAGGVPPALRRHTISRA